MIKLKRILQIAGLSMAGLVNFNASAGNAGDSVKATQISGEVTIDGRLDDKAWENAPFYEIRNGLGGKPLENVQTRFKILQDEYALYVGVVCAEPSMAQLKAKAKDRDVGVYEDDCVELFINPNKQSGTYAHFVVNALGTVYDARAEGTAEESKWNAQGLEVTAHRGDAQWSVELKIPFCNFYALYPELDKRKAISAASWSMNIVRSKRTPPGGYSTYAALSELRDTAKYAALDGIQIDYSKFLWRFVNLSGGIKPEGDQFRFAFQGSVENKADRFRIVSIEQATSEIVPISVKACFRRSSVVEKAIGIDKGQVFPAKFSDTLQNQGQYTVALLIKDKEQILAWESKDLSLTYSPLTLSVVKPFYHSAIYATMDVRNITLRVGSDIAGELSPQEKCRVFLKNEKGEIITEQEYPLQASLSKDIELSIPKLAPGEYTCRVEYKNHSAETPLHVYAPSQSEVRFNEHRNLVVNGKEVFPMGSFQRYWQLGLDGNESINFGIFYSPVKDLSANPEYAVEVETSGALDRNGFIFPEPASIWGHQDVDRNHLRTKPLPPENAALIAKHVSQYQNLKGFWGWYLSDEPMTGVQLPEYLERVAATVRKADPYHPCLISFNTENAVGTYGNAFDICGLHNFLFFGFDSAGKKVVDVPILSIANAVDVAVKQVNNLRPVWLALSITPYRHSPEGRTPDYDEARCMAYLGIAHGAKGIYWNSPMDSNAHLDALIGYPALSEELRMLEKVFLAHTEVKVEAAGPDAAKLHTQGKVVDGKLYVIAVNPYPNAIAAAIKLPPEWANGTLFELASERRECTLTDGVLDLPMASYEARIFSSDPAAPNPPSVASVKNRIKTENERLKTSGNLCYFDRGVTVALSFSAGNSIEAKRSLVDGCKKAYWCWRATLAPKADNWIEISFPKPEIVARIEISWQVLNEKVKADKAYTFRAQYKDGDKDYADITDSVASEEFDPKTMILTRKITFVKVTATGLKICLPTYYAKPDNYGNCLFPSEIQAFAE